MPKEHKPQQQKPTTAPDNAKVAALEPFRKNGM